MQDSGTVTQPVKYLANDTALLVFNNQSPSEKTY